MRITNPAIVANIIGATVFLVLAIFYLMMSKHDDDTSWSRSAAKLFAMLFSSLAIATSIAISK